MHWEWVPVVGKNPVFWLEVRRLWRRRTVLVLLAVVLGLGAVGWGACWVLLALMPLGVVPVSVERGIRAVVPSPTGFVPLPGRPYTPGAPAWMPWAYWGSWGLRWAATVVGQYLAPALAALSLERDRAGGVLAPVLASRLSVRELMIGKLTALALPLVAVAALVGAGFALLASAADSAHLVSPSVPVKIITGVLVAITLGLRVGAGARRPAVALALSILLAGVVLPFGAGVLLEVVHSCVDRSKWSSAGRDADRAVAIALDLALLLALWFSTKRALGREGE